jgi:hypothetical protein
MCDVIIGEDTRWYMVMEISALQREIIGGSLAMLSIAQIVQQLRPNLPTFSWGDWGNPRKSQSDGRIPGRNSDRQGPERDSRESYR